MYQVEIIVVRKDEDTGQIVDSRQVFIQRRNLAQSQLIVKLLFDLVTVLRRTVYVKGRA